MDTPCHTGLCLFASFLDVRASPFAVGRDPGNDIRSVRRRQKHDVPLPASGQPNAARMSGDVIEDPEVNSMIRRTLNR
jgi:hypothetical protein